MTLFNVIDETGTHPAISPTQAKDKDSTGADPARRPPNSGRRRTPRRQGPMTNTMEHLDTDRAEHFDRLQAALEEGLKAINAARSPEEAEQARLRARRRLEELNLEYESAFVGH